LAAIKNAIIWSWNSRYLLFFMVLEDWKSKIWMPVWSDFGDLLFLTWRSPPSHFMLTDREVYLLPHLPIHHSVIPLLCLHLKLITSWKSCLQI
jgi:hypothetical protein